MKCNKIAAPAVTIRVAPFAGAWIEIEYRKKKSRVKSVAPFAGAWIEIHNILYIATRYYVAPFAGAWIEINIDRYDLKEIKSHPSRVRGLKYSTLYY